MKLKALICIGEDKDVRRTIRTFEETFDKEVELLTTDFRMISETLHGELIKKHLILNNHDYFVRKLITKDQMVHTTNKNHRYIKPEPGTPSPKEPTSIKSPTNII